MSPAAGGRAGRWLDWAGEAATEAQQEIMWDRWAAGEEPPSAPITPEWPSDEPAASRGVDPLSPVGSGASKGGTNGHQT